MYVPSEVSITSETSAYEEDYNVKSVSKSKSSLTLKSRYRLYFQIMAELEFLDLIYFEECTAV
jgi:hypothetical protein